MEKLLAYALLLFEGFEIEDKYKKHLDELFTDDPNNAFLLDLELMSCIGESITYIRTNFNYENMDEDHFGWFLMKELKQLYTVSDINSFAEKMYSLWGILPDIIRDRQPFFTLCYADDYLSFGDEAQTRETYERMFDYFEN